jgi:two-component system response regulator FlrC
MHVALQAKLLRVLQEREVERVGGRQPVRLDVRVLATTNQDLRAAVRAGRFREDLYYRLSVFPVSLPPLRQRPADIVALARYFIAGATPKGRPVPALTEGAAAALMGYGWPGNVRELANLMQRAVILCTGRDIEATDLRFEAVEAEGTVTVNPTGGMREVTAAGSPVGLTVPVPVTVPPAIASADSARLQDNLQNVEGRLIIDAIHRSGSRKRAAELLGISPRTLRYKLARLRDAGVDVPGREFAAIAG